MTEEVTRSSESEGNAAFSRRNALKAGAAVGVGAAVWSGVSITSLGGTPAYAASCTGVVNIDLSAGCRNTSNNCAPFAYHPLKATGLPTGFAVGTAAHPNVGENTCCTLNSQVEFTFPDDLTCVVLMVTYANEGLCGKLGQRQGTFNLGGPDDDGSLLINLGCVADTTSSTFYTINALCSTTGADPDCLGTTTTTVP